MDDRRVYLDANATTRPSADVGAAVAHALAEGWGNPSSLHTRGRRAAVLLSEARRDVAAWLGAAPAEVSFTSGGTEALRLALLGALSASGERRHVVCSAIEHAAVRDLLRAAPTRRWGAGLDVTWVRPGRDGAVAADDVAAALRPDTALVAVMWANNETGVVQPVEALAAACRAAGALYLVDAVQAAGKLPLDFAALGGDLMAVSAHKVHGPQGVGALVVRSGACWTPPQPASHELGRRAGTEPLPAIAGFAAAARACRADLEAADARMAALRDRFERVVTGALGDVDVNGSGPRTPNTSNLLFHGLAADSFLARLDNAGIDASNGSACSTRSPEPSHVLLAMGLSHVDAQSSVRFSLGRDTTDADIDRATAVVIETVETMRRKKQVARRRG